MDCVDCGGLLTGRQKKYCSAVCSKHAGRAAWIMRTYGITMEEWDQIWEFQGKRCPITGRTPRPKEVFHVDHEHGGAVRGIVSPYANTRLIVRLKDHETAQRLADYLRNPPATAALGRQVIAPGRPKKKRQPRRRAR